MAFVFDATISGPDSNSYTLVTEADDYFTGTIDSDVWSTLSTTVKEQFLVMATTRLESESYGGYPATETQRLQQPRDNVISRYAGDYYNSNGYYPDTIYYPVDSIPKEMQQASFELAMYFYDKSIDNLGTIDEIDLEQLTSYEIGPLAVEIASGFKVEQLPQKVKRMLIASGPTMWGGYAQRTTSIRG